MWSFKDPSEKGRKLTPGERLLRVMCCQRAPCVTPVKSHRDSRRETSLSPFFSEELRSGRLSNLPKVKGRAGKGTKVCLTPKSIFVSMRPYAKQYFPWWLQCFWIHCIYYIRPQAKLFVNSIGTNDTNCNRCYCPFGIYQLNKCLLVYALHEVISPKRLCLLTFAWLWKSKAFGRLRH